MQHLKDYFGFTFSFLVILKVTRSKVSAGESQTSEPVGAEFPFQPWRQFDLANANSIGPLAFPPIEGQQLSVMIPCA